MFAPRKIWCALLPCYLRLEIRSPAPLPTNYPYSSALKQQISSTNRKRYMHLITWITTKTTCTKRLNFFSLLGKIDIILSIRIVKYLVMTYPSLQHSINAVHSGSFAFTFYIQGALFICLLLKISCHISSPILNFREWLW